MGTPWATELVEAGRADESLALGAFFQLIVQLKADSTLEVCVVHSMGGMEVLFVDVVL